MEDHSWMQGMVRGYVWKVRMWGGTVFEQWTPKDISRKEARDMLLELANGDFKIYTNEDIISLWRINGGR